MTEYKFKREPRAHQLRGFEISRDEEYFALFMDMGTGKTKVTIDTIAWLYLTGKIDGALIVAPNGVYMNWINNELAKDMPDEVARCMKVAWHDADGKKADKDRLESFMREAGKPGLRILATNVEAFRVEKRRLAGSTQVFEDFLKQGRMMMIIDESTTIKHGDAMRTKVAKYLGKAAKYRRILCGNPYANSPLDVYEPCAFLHPMALGISSFFAFKARFAKLVKMKVRTGKVDPRTGQEITREFSKIESYHDLDYLKKLVSRFSYTVKKDECLDLPPKIYLEPRYFEMTAKQTRAYKEMKKYSLTEIDRQLSLGLDPPSGREIKTTEQELAEMRGAAEFIEPELPEEIGRTASAKIVLTKLLRLQQITCGFVMDDDGHEVDLCDGKNPRVEAILDAIRECRGKVIIWATFRRSIQELVDALVGEYGSETVLRFDGTTKDPTAVSVRFQDLNDPARFIVSNQQKGARGNTWTAAELVLYFSNLYDNELREQSEDRPHRDGLTHAVSYQDVRAKGTEDEKVSAALVAKKSIAEMLRDGSWREWFRP